MFGDNYLRKNRIIFLKLLSLLSLVRWYNILLIIFAQYLAAHFIIQPEGGWKAVVFDPGLFLVALSSAFIIAAGYIINGFYDVEKDLINRPKQTAFHHFVSKRFRLNCYVLFNTLGLLLGYMVSPWIFVFNGLFAFTIWLYSHKLKKISFVGNIFATVLSVTAFFSICVYYGQITSFVVLYTVFIFLVELTREILKDLEAVKGDQIYGYNTLPVRYGVKRSKQVMVLLMLVTASIPIVISMLRRPGVVLFYFYLSMGLILISILLLRNASEVSHFHRINRIYKVIILLGILSIALI